MTGRIAAWRRRRKQSRFLGARLLAAFARTHPQATFVEIGANDGLNHDHLRGHVGKRPWTGLMVEPVPHVFERLAANYGDTDGVTLVNAAIAEHDGRLPFFHLAEPRADERASLPSWFDAIGSFRRDVLLSHAAEVPGLEDRIVEREVEALSFDTLLARHGLDRVDLLVIDTEGYDSVILHSIDFARHRPRLMIYEHYHLSPAEREDTLALVRSHGYRTEHELYDTYCLQPGPGDALDRAWSRYEPAFPAVSKHDEIGVAS